MRVPTFLSKSTRSPPTTITTTEMPAIAPVERALLYALEDAQLDPSALGAYPSTHSQTPLLSLEFAGHVSMQPFLSGRTFLLVHFEHVTRGAPLLPMRPWLCTGRSRLCLQLGRRT